MNTATETFLQGLAERLGMPTNAPTKAVTVPVATSSPLPAADRGGAEYMRLFEAARFACVSEPTLRGWGHRGLRILRPSRGVVLVKRSDLIAFIEGGSQ